MANKDNDRNSTLPPRPGSLSQRKKVISVLALSGFEDSKKQFHFQKDRVVFGTVVSADVRLKGEGISPIHAVLEIKKSIAQDGVFGVIYDLASDAGILVNDQKTVTKEVRPGDRLRIGHYEFSVELKDEDDASILAKPYAMSEGRTLYGDASEDLSSYLIEDQHSVEEIFDYRPTQRQAIEVVMSWKSSILDVEHYIDQETVTIGDHPKNDFPIPSSLENSQHPLISVDAEGYVLSVTRGMKGVVQKGGALARLSGESDSRIILGTDDFAKISIGELDFYVSFTAAPPHLMTRKLFDKDPLFLKIMGSSLVLSIMTIFALTQVTVEKEIEVEELPDRIATILYQPEKYSAFNPPPVVSRPREQQDSSPVKKVEEPKAMAQKVMPMPPKKLVLKKGDKRGSGRQNMSRGEVVKSAKKAGAMGSRVSQRRSKEGEGARARGAEGRRGSSMAKRTGDPMYRASRTSPRGGSGRGSGNSQVKDDGNIDILKGAGKKIQDLLGNSAARLGQSGKRLKGFGGFDTVGNDGLALSGSGPGGGGSAATTLGGLGKKGRGGGRVGTGQGAVGRGSEIVGGRSRVELRTGGSEESIVMGSIDSAAVYAAIRRHADEFRLCYERELNAGNPSLTGAVGTSFVIGPRGKVTQAGVTQSSIKNPNVDRCVLRVIRRIQFPVPRGGGVVEVKIPFKFNASR